MSEIRYSRGLSLRQVMGRGLGVIVIVTAFVLLGDAIGVAGPFTPLAFFLALLLLLANLLGYVELSLSGSRRSGAYGQARDAEHGWVSFFTGWALILSGLGLCALLARGFGDQVTALLRDHLGLAVPLWPWAAGLVLLLATNNALGTREGRSGLISGFLLVMVVLVGLTLLAVPNIDVAHFSGGPRDWRQALSLLMASFVGLEITATLQSEMGQRTRGVPRALLVTPALAALVGAVVATVIIGVVGSGALTDSRLPLALLGSSVAGGAGRPLILAVGALALAVAFNSALVLVVRQLYAMSKDGYWPSGLVHTHRRFGTPVWIIMVVATILLFLTMVPTRFLGRLTGLLYLIVLMGVNLTLTLRPQSESASFRLPFHPWLPGLTLVIDVLVISLWGPVITASAAVCLGIGAILFLTYARDHHIRAQEGVTVFKPPSKEKIRPGYHVLVPIANPATAGTLLRLAGVLARQQGGAVLALQVVTVPEQVPLEEGRHRAAVGRVLLERAMAQAKEEGFAIQTMTRVAHSVAEGILDTAREEGVDMILLGWRGYTRSAGASMGPIIDAVIRDAPCEVTVVKGEKWRQASKILVPTAGGPHAPIAARLAMVLSGAFESDVTAVYVQLGRATHRQMEENKQRIARTLNGLHFPRPPEQKVIVADSVVEGIVREAEDYDLVLLGASEEGLFDQFVFGSIPQQIAARVPKTAVIVRRYGGATEFWIRKLTRGLFQLLPRLNVEEQLELREAMRDSARPGVNFFVLIVLSSIIATLGLLLDSAAVVIGAMLVAPLMSPILGFSLGMVLGDVRLIRLSVESMFKGVALALLLAVLIGILSPFKELTEEIMMRTQPTLIDLAVAMASGMAGAYALSRDEVSAALPGVAISAALMPPLGVAGLGLALGRPQVAGGAFLLFLANIAAISLAGVIIFILLGVRSQTWQPETNRRIRRGLFGFVVLVLVIAIPLGIIMAGIVRHADTRQEIQQVLTEEMSAQHGTLVVFEHQSESGSLEVVATVRSSERLDEGVVDAMASALERRLDRSVKLEVIVLPVVRSQES
ncbi:MAG: TIGR00341 family protein [Anaerolineae bacterium]